MRTKYQFVRIGELQPLPGDSFRIITWKYVVEEISSSRKCLDCSELIIDLFFLMNWLIEVNELSAAAG